MQKAMAFALICAVSAPLFAQSLGDKKTLEKWQESLQAKTEQFKVHCGHDLPVTLNTNLIEPFTAKDMSGGAYCGGLIDSMSGLCNDATYKSAISGKIKSISCSYAAQSAHGDFKLGPNGTLEASFGLDSSNMNDALKAFLDKNL